MSLPLLKKFSPMFFMKTSEEKNIWQKQMETLRIKAPGAKTLASSLSGGNQQKVVLAKWLMTEPKILLLDEPTKGIDAWSKHQLGLLMRDLQKKGITVLMVTHDVEFAAAVSDRCGLFFDHEITSLDTPEDFFCSNNYYTTAANRISRQQYDNAVTCEDVIELCRQNGRLADAQKMEGNTL